MSLRVLHLRVELKRQFLDDELKKSGKSGAQSMTGSRWYSLEAFRATNQAVGRVIRHSRYTRCSSLKPPFNIFSL